MAANKAREILVTATLKGISPMLQLAMSEDTVWDVLVCGDRPPIDKTMTRIERAKLGLYKGPKGEYGVPGVNLSACLCEAGRSVKMDGRKAISTATSTLLPSFLTLEDVFMPFSDLLDPPWVPDVRRGVMKNAGKSTAVGITRPRFDSWTLKPTMRVDLTVGGITEETIRKLVETAGSRIGLCSFNPLHRGPFGRFIVTEWKSKPIEAGMTEGANAVQ